jgi:hypothetical protein
MDFSIDDEESKLGGLEGRLFIPHSMIIQPIKSDEPQSQQPSLSDKQPVL